MLLALKHTTVQLQLHANLKNVNSKLIFTVLQLIKDYSVKIVLI